VQGRFPAQNRMNGLQHRLPIGVFYQKAISSGSHGRINAGFV
jgi:hypothetical protein